MYAMTTIPVMQGIIERRILVNYRVEPATLARLLPAPFRPKIVHGFGIAGICLIRLRAIRPRFAPALLGISSENAAHRIAVEWDDQGQRREGVYIPRRDTSSRWNTLAGGRIFPGVHHHAMFAVHESGDQYAVTLESDDRRTHLSVAGHIAAALPAASVFGSLENASAFFERGSLGYSATSDPQRFDGLELRSERWHVEPLAVERVTSSFFDDPEQFPDAAIAFDCALIMRDVAHEWHGRGPLCAPLDHAA
jgi:hypothetical protein